MVKLGKDLLRKLNYKVEGYTDASEAMERFRGNPELFDLIISDMTMPIMNGFRVIEEVRQIKPGIPVIICSGYNEQINDTKVSEIGFHYIQKPIEMNTISKAVKDLLDNL